MHETNDPEGHNNSAQRRLPDDQELLLALYSSIVLGQARLYDVLIALLGESNPDKANRILEFHKEGRLMFPPIAVRNDNHSK